MVGSDAQTDLAIIRSEDLEGRALEIRDEPVHPGELCLTVGAPLGYSDSVSLGIVSGLGRQIAMGDIKFEEVIQTDASINPGNSGGPLVDIEGQLIGVNYSKRTDSENIGFAIPVEIMRDVTSEICELEVRRGRLGIGISSQASDRGNCWSSLRPTWSHRLRQLTSWSPSTAPLSREGTTFSESSSKVPFLGPKSRYACCEAAERSRLTWPSSPKSPPSRRNSPCGDL